MQEIIHPSTAVDDFSVKRIFTDEGTLDRESLWAGNPKQLPLGKEDLNTSFLWAGRTQTN